MSKSAAEYADQLNEITDTSEADSDQAAEKFIAHARATLTPDQFAEFAKLVDLDS